MTRPKLQTSIYDILPLTTSLTGYAIGLRKPPATLQKGFSLVHKRHNVSNHTYKFSCMNYLALHWHSSTHSRHASTNNWNWIRTQFSLDIIACKGNLPWKMAHVSCCPIEIPVLFNLLCVWNLYQVMCLLLSLTMLTPAQIKPASFEPRWHSSGAVWESRWPSWAVRPNEPSGFRGRKAILNHASALVSACP